MKLWIFSDLHLEFETLPLSLDIPDADVCVCAGDVTNGIANAVHWLGQHVAPHMPVVLVPGNHEYYGNSLLEGFEDGRHAASQFPDVHLLDNRAAEIGGVRFLGCTLWTDFRIDGGGEHETAWSMAVASQQVNDFRQIAARRLPAYEAFTPARATERHKRSRAFLERELADGGIPTVVVTHHAPHPGSVHRRYKGSSLNAAFASDLTGVIEAGGPRLWVHGHVHDSFDYAVGSTRVLCNPRGYDGENARFDPTMIVEV